MKTVIPEILANEMYFHFSFYTGRGPTPPESVDLLKLNGGSPHDTTGSTGGGGGGMSTPVPTPLGPPVIGGGGPPPAQDAILTQVQQQQHQQQQHSQQPQQVPAPPTHVLVGGVGPAGLGGGPGGAVRIPNGVRRRKKYEPKKSKSKTTAFQEMG